MPIVKKPVTRHNGIYTFTGMEAGNTSMGQAGFDILKGANNTTGRHFIAGPGTNSVSPPIFYFPEVRFWVALKAINGAGSSIIAKTLIGDDFMTIPTAGFDSVLSSSSSYNLDLEEDDTINGAFTEIRICDGVTYIQAFRQ